LLAEVLAVDFDAEEIPKLRPDWRWEEQELALQSACSSLIAIVEAGDSRVVQFSHFSVKEFLTSSRLATSSGEISSYHIDLEPAHTILAQACLCVLLQIQNVVEGHTPKDHPLARYAAEHWITHAQFGEVSSRLQKGMEYLFDPAKPHFEMWLTLYDIDTRPDDDTTFHWFAPLVGNRLPASHLYYAALCGFHDLVKHLITKYSLDVNAEGGFCMRPLVAALAGEHFQTADLLHHKGAGGPHVQGYIGNTPLHSAAYFGNLEMVQKLIEYGADINARDRDRWTVLYWVSRGRFFKDGTVLRLLLELGADVNARARGGESPLHRASEYKALGVVALLLEHGADVEAEDIHGGTALQVAAVRGHDEIVKLLRENGAK